MLYERLIGAFILVVTVLATTAGAQTPTQTGILLLAHGGSAAWNERIAELASGLNAQQPVEVALGMASKGNIQQGVDRLVERGVTSIVAVPLFVSSHSSVITSTQYLLGLRSEAPADLAIFAKMNHAAHAGGSASAQHAHHDAADATTPVKAPVPIRMSAALDRHPIVADILATRARALSQSPRGEAVIVVAHGPTRDDENQKWLDDMAVLAEGIKDKVPFRSVDYMTVRDDAPAPIRDAAAAELRALVQRRSGEGARVLIVPLLLSYGGIEAGIRKRLDGLDYVMAEQALAPDDRLGEWVTSSARAAAADGR